MFDDVVVVFCWCSRATHSVGVIQNVVYTEYKYIENLIFFQKRIYRKIYVYVYDFFFKRIKILMNIDKLVFLSLTEAS